MPGIGLVIDGAMQQAPQPGRHATALDEGGRASGICGLSALVARLRQPA